MACSHTAVLFVVFCLAVVGRSAVLGAWGQSRELTLGPSRRRPDVMEREKKFGCQRGCVLTSAALSDPRSMSVPHVCIRSALTQALRPSNCRVAAPYSVAAFLVPCIAHCTRRPFSTTKPRRHDLGPTAQAGAAQSSKPNPRLETPEQPSSSRISYPPKDARADIQQWLAAIDPFLPPALSRSTAVGPDVSASVTSLDLAQILNAAQDASQDLLSHLGLAEQRWDTVVWIAKKLAEDGRQSFEPSAPLKPYLNVVLPGTYPPTLDRLTSGPLFTRRARTDVRLSQTLDDLTSVPESFGFRYQTLKRALGQLWRSLATMILAATESDRVQHDLILSRVLEMIANLHHMGFIPPSVYSSKQNPDPHALQQPPTLPLLASEILTALSDATWRAHEASVKVAAERMNAQYFLGHEIPGSRYKIHVTELAPELWLELVLWSCLHGGWILDGSAILEKIAELDIKESGSSPEREFSWGLVSWRELMQAGHNEAADSQGWRVFRRRREAAKQTDDRGWTRRKISSEIVAATIDGLVNNMRLAVGTRGTAPEDLVARIKRLKRFLDRNALSLGSTTWDSVMLRLLESGGILPEKRPEMLLSLVDLVSGFGTEVSSANASPKPPAAVSEPPYFFEPTTFPIGLSHRAMRAFIQNGDIAGTMRAFDAIRLYTDSNKQKSLEQFFTTLKDISLIRDEPFTSIVSPIEFPAFDPQLPIPLLAKLLELITDSEMYDLGRWLLFSDDLDGPLIHSHMYTRRAMAAAIIRFGALSGENDLVLDVVKKTGSWHDEDQTERMPNKLLDALLCSQVKLRRWNSVGAMKDHVLTWSTYQPQAKVVAVFAAEPLRLSLTSSDTQSLAKTEAVNAFTDLLHAWDDLLMKHIPNEVYCILGILSTIREEWREYCSQFLRLPARRRIQLSTADFNHVLGGVLDGYGSLQGRATVEMWCYTHGETFKAYRASGGLVTMPRFWAGQGEEYDMQPDNIEIIQPSGLKLVLRGRVSPNRRTVQAVLRKVQQEESQRQERGEKATAVESAEVRGTIQWATRLLRNLGFEHEDITRDLGNLARLAELEAPPSQDFDDRVRRHTLATGLGM